MTAKKHPHLHRPTGPYVRSGWERVRTVTPVSSESKTVASLGNDTDVNQIVARFARTGIMPQPQKEAQWADVSNLQGKDLTELIEQAQIARDNLATLNQEKDRRLKEAAENANNQENQKTEQNAQPAAQPDAPE